ncbi:MAG: hypothetical protein V1722_01835 [Candidatus Micrarchaeota archaeon]
MVNCLKISGVLVGIVFGILYALMWFLGSSGVSDLFYVAGFFSFPIIQLVIFLLAGYLYAYKRLSGFLSVANGFALGLIFYLLGAALSDLVAPAVVRFNLLDPLQVEGFLLYGALSPLLLALIGVALAWLALHFGLIKTTNKPAVKSSKKSKVSKKNKK